MKIKIINVTAEVFGLIIKSVANNRSVEYRNGKLIGDKRQVDDTINLVSYMFDGRAREDYKGGD